MKIVRFKKAFLTICLTMLIAIAIPVAAIGADVDVYGEGVIDDNGLTVYLYADVNVDQLLSYGVKLGYNTEELTVADVQKDPESATYTSNETKWYLGEASATYKSNPAPDTSVAGEITIIGGKLDPADPTQGVSGTRILLAKIQFSAVGEEIPASTELTLAYAVGDGTSTYKNYVRLSEGSPVNLDGTGVEFGSVKVCPRGDASGDGRILPNDINAVKANIGNPDAPCYKDCTGDGRILPNDINCVKSKI